MLPITMTTRQAMPLTHLLMKRTISLIPYPAMLWTRNKALTIVCAARRNARSIPRPLEPSHSIRNGDVGAVEDEAVGAVDAEAVGAVEEVAAEVAVGDGVAITRTTFRVVTTTRVVDEAGMPPRQQPLPPVSSTATVVSVRVRKAGMGYIVDDKWNLY